MECLTPCLARSAFPGADRPRRRARAALPVVVAAVPVGRRNLADLDAVEAVHVERGVVTAELGEMAEREHVDAAARTEMPLRDLVAPLVRARRVGAGDDADLVGLDDHRRHRELRADRAIAPTGAFGEVARDLETNGTAVAASGMGLRRHDRSLP